MTLTVEAEVEEGYELQVSLGEQVLTANEDGTYTITMPAEDATLTITTVAKKFVVAFEADENGTIAVTDGENAIESQSEVEYGTVLAITATPNEGYRLKEILVNDEALEAVDGEYVYTVKSITLITASFEAIPATYAVTFEQPENGSLAVTVDGENINSGDAFEAGTVLTIVPTPDEGYQVANVTVNDQAIAATDDAYTYTLADTAVTIAATFEAAPVTYCHPEGNSTHTGRYITTLNVSDNEGTSLDVSGSGLQGALYTDHTDQVFTTKRGSEVTVNVTAGGGEWMHAYVLVDYNNDGEFTYDVNTTKADQELVAFNCYGAGVSIGSDASTWYNSLGEEVSNHFTYVDGNIPAFTIPEDLADGEYRLRYKMDWNDADPCGRASGSNLSSANGGFCIDLTLKVEGTSAIDTVIVDGVTIFVGEGVLDVLIDVDIESVGGRSRHFNAEDEVDDGA